MQTSDEALEAITDAGHFEQLATAIIRRVHPQGAALIHTGVNAQGKPVRSPVDGIAVGSTGMLFVHHTTTARNSLRTKWMGDDGDIRKTAKCFSEELGRNPTLIGTLMLTTNRVPDEGLVRDSVALASMLQLRLEIWDRSRLTDYLDHDPDGQFLRHKFLGISEERLSGQLLTEISQASAKAMRETLHDDERAWIDRDVSRRLASRFESGEVMTFLAMPSGFGKSTAASRYLSSWVAEENHFGLWIQAHTLEQSLTLNEVISRTLHASAPELGARTGQAARDLSGSENPLVLVVDDISRSSESSTLIERLASWMQTEKNRGERNIRVVCPVWPQLIEQLPQARRRYVEATSLVGDALSQHEATEAVKSRARLAGRNITQMEAQEIGEALGYDPLLIALSAGADTASPPRMQVIPEFIRGQLSQQEARDGSFLKAEGEHALVALANNMLMHRNIAPTWADIAGWLTTEPSTLSSLGSLLKQRTIIRMDRVHDGERLTFRHDRVRTNVLAIAMAKGLTKEFCDDYFGDPYFAEAFGLALAQGQSNWGLEFARRVNPLALLYALTIVADRSGVYATALVKALCTWLQTEGQNTKSTEWLQWAMQWVSTHLDNPAALEIIDKFTVKGGNKDYARFRNGDIVAGARISLSWDPSIRASHRDQLIDHVKMVNWEVLRNSLSLLLADASIAPEIHKGALYLAGFISDSTLQPAICECWKLHGTDAEFLSPFIWAALNCAGDNPKAFLDPILDFWASLPEKVSETRNEPHRMLPLDEGLQSGFARGMPESVMVFLMKCARNEERLRWPIELLLEQVDHPDVMEFIARERAEGARRREAAGNTFSWDMHDHPWANNWSMSVASRTRLQQLWASEASDAHLQKQAFRMWMRKLGSLDLPMLRSIAPISPLYDASVRKRIFLRDPTAISVFREKLLSADSTVVWWQDAREAPMPELADVLDEEFARRRAALADIEKKTYFDSDVMTSSVLMNLEPELAQRLLHKHWNHLQCNRTFVHCALYLADPVSREMARVKIKQSADPRKALQFLNYHWEIGGTEQRGRLTVARLEALEPYLEFFDERAIQSLWVACNVDGFFTWRRMRLDARFSDEWKIRYGVGDEALFRNLDDFLQSKTRPWFDHWLSEFEERGDDPSTAMRVVGDWLKSRNTVAAFEIAAQCVAIRGTRKDFKLLANCEMDGRATKAILANTCFAVFRRSIQ